MFIYAIKIEDIKKQQLLNAIKYICSPSSKTEAHISVRGLYKIRQKAKIVKKVNQSIKGSKIQINGVGNFFNENQNTVYLNADGEELKKVWHKSTFPHYAPHITLYNGKDTDFAQKLYQFLLQFNIAFEFNSSELIAYDLSNKNLSFLLSLEISQGFFEESLELNYSPEDISHLNETEKFKIIKVCIEKLQGQKELIKREPTLY